MFFKEDRLLECVQAVRGHSAREIQNAILADVREFVGDASQSDDIALMVVARDPAER
jgi:serine phosphatase RsbU (regulator of sigma subunit)